MTTRSENADLGREIKIILEMLLPPMSALGRLSSSVIFLLHLAVLVSIHQWHPAAPIFVGAVSGDPRAGPPTTSRPASAGAPSTGPGVRSSTRPASSTVLPSGKPQPAPTDRTAHPSTTGHPDTTGRPTTSPKQTTSSSSSDQNKKHQVIHEPVLHFNLLDVARFLDSHPAASLHDPRAFFTEEPPLKALGLIMGELKRMPKKLSFAYLARAFNDFGRKLACKLNYCAHEILNLLKKNADQPGNEPNANRMVDAIERVFESKEDMRTGGDGTKPKENAIKQQLALNKDKKDAWEGAQKMIASRLGGLLAFVARGSGLPNGQPNETGARYLSEAFGAGLKAALDELGKNDRFRVHDEVIEIGAAIADGARRHLAGQFKAGAGDATSLNKHFQAKLGQFVNKTFSGLSSLTDANGLVGPWNGNLLQGLVTSERAVRLFAALIERVPAGAKARWHNMYANPMKEAVERAMPAFVLMQRVPYLANSSDAYLLDSARSATATLGQEPAGEQARDSYETERDKVPARCYLAGRRWRLALRRGLAGLEKGDEPLAQLAERVDRIRAQEAANDELFRSCLPRLATGLRGLGINGDMAAAPPAGNFPFKNPLEGLDLMGDPFRAGVRLGYRIAFKLGFNDERNVTRPRCAPATSSKPAAAQPPSGGPSSGPTQRPANGTPAASVSKRPTPNGNAISDDLIAEVTHKAFRTGALSGAKKAFHMALREGFLGGLRVSIRAGEILVVEAGGKLGAAEGKSFGGQQGALDGRSAAESLLVAQKVQLERKQHEKALKVAELSGKQGGEVMGEQVGALVGRLSAQEAYRRNIIRGGRLKQARFHLDEYISGAKLGFDYGLKRGKQVASSSNLDPSAPRYLKLAAAAPAEASAQLQQSSDVDHWEKDIIPTIPEATFVSFESVRNHTLLEGELKGSVKLTKEVKDQFKRVDYGNVTYSLNTLARGFVSNGILYLTLNGTVDDRGSIRGSALSVDGKKLVLMVKP